MGDVAQNSSRIIGVVQDHRNKRRMRPHTYGLQRGRVRDDAPNLSDAAVSVTKVFEGNPGESQSRYLMVLDLFSSPNVLFV